MMEMTFVSQIIPNTKQVVKVSGIAKSRMIFLDKILLLFVRILIEINYQLTLHLQAMQQ